jgi:hypothetical protein
MITATSTSKMNPPIPPSNRYVCTGCGKLTPPLYRHNNWMCRFVGWLDNYLVYTQKK